ncbi:MAG: Hydrolase, alpha/beta fold family [uncultured Truepera sp.]|uniref:Hydrolase, alpha/beta fold family n=1 Tax=uncultured Truepera sp. TaxID=543023 RepID=A0A6J4VRU6_9DEIN|nr:MAG: Hydrolase, alpha/beta fold family [uncultured Truepera sp.]
MRVDNSMRVRTVQLSQGPIQYLDIGNGPVLLFVHGLLVNGEMWRKVYRPLSARFRCIVPTLPLGGHVEPMREDADFTPTGMADLINEFMAALGLGDATLVGCDTGGALSQLVAVHHPERVGRLVLTNCDAFEHFPPPLLRPFEVLFRLPGGASFFGLAVRLRPVQNLLYALLAHAPLEPTIAEGYFKGFIHSRAVRRDTKKFISSISNRYTLEAAEHFSEFRRPVLVAWGEDDRFFTLRFGERLAQAFPHARLERVEGSKTFVSEDQPEVLNALITDFVLEPVLA